jgi:Zn-dependent peptidase ImmA (M78 family)
MTGLRISELEVARLESPGTPDAQLVIHLAQRTLTELGLEPPINHDIIASMRDVVRIEEESIPWAGCLVHENCELVIKVRAGDSTGKKRFTVFHEIKHTYMPGFVATPQYRCDPATPQVADRIRDRDLEGLCDLGAVELLLPRTHFAEDLAGNPPTLDLVEALADRYDASLEATARRIVTLRPQPTMLIALEPASKPAAPGAEPQLRVQWAQASGKWPYIPKHKSVPDDSPLAQPLLGEVVDEPGDLAGLTKDLISNVHISARLYPYGDDQGKRHMRVLALLSPIDKRHHGH